MGMESGTVVTEARREILARRGPEDVVEQRLGRLKEVEETLDALEFDLDLDLRVHSLLSGGGLIEDLRSVASQVVESGLFHELKWVPLLKTLPYRERFRGHPRMRILGAVLDCGLPQNDVFGPETWRMWYALLSEAGDLYLANGVIKVPLWRREFTVGWVEDRAVRRLGRDFSDFSVRLQGKFSSLTPEHLGEMVLDGAENDPRPWGEVLIADLRESVAEVVSRRTSEQQTRLARIKRLQTRFSPGVNGGRDA